MAHLSSHSDCKTKTKGLIRKALCAVIKAGGRPAFEAVKQAHNAFINTLSGLASTIILVIEPIVTIDKFVIETFVKPPLVATIAVVDGATKAFTIPLRVIRSLDKLNECGRFHTNLRGSMDTAIQFLRKDLLKLKFLSEELDLWIEDSEARIQEIKDFADRISFLLIVEDYEVFVNNVCPTISP
jgi:hypothetical protein